MANLSFGPDFDADSLSPGVALFQCSPFSLLGILLFPCLCDSCREQNKALGLVFLNEPLQVKDLDPTELASSVLVPVKEFFCTLKTTTA